ncbi:MAG: hypothetical protein Q9160_006710 [Pyrenula sp. 1 TL-2023]
MAHDGEQIDRKSRPPLIASESQVLMKYTKVTLNPVEALLKKLLLGCRDHYAVGSSNWSKPASELELRFTGGWVRDKLLGIESHDIDVALSSMTGAQFGEMLKDYVTDHGESYREEARSASVNDSFKDIHRIKANPEQSKHLETATTRIFGLDIDLVNLRKETYTADSRNPQVEFGTPKEDADRRDATINAMFYNLDKDAVEDFTERGFVDLKSGIIRTPLAPYETFTDDPLRILRLIRFASKYGYKISPEAEECMTNAKIHEALNRKITRERVGIEIEKMFGGPNPLRALSTIHHLGLLKVVFQGPSSQAWRNATKIPDVYKALDDLKNSENNLFDELLSTREEVQCSWYLVAYLAWYNPQERTQYLPKSVEIFRDAIKASNKLTDRLRCAVRYQEEASAMATKAHSQSLTRSDVGMTLKRWGSTWRSTVVFAMLYEIQQEAAKETIVQKYESFVSYILEQKLLSADKEKPIINGNDVAKHFGLKTGGPWLKKALDAVLEWQFANPEGKASAVYEVLNEKRGELGIPPPAP